MKLQAAIISIILTMPISTAAFAGLDEGQIALKNKNYTAALKEFMPLSEQGDMLAQANLGLMYSNGFGVKKDDVKALSWFKRAAEQGLDSAQHNVGLAYQFGRGVDINYAKAADWYKKAADQGYESSQLNLGYLYLNGDGVPQDFKKAAALYKKAGEQGNAIALYSLGEIFESGYGLPKDLMAAHVFYSLAAARGDSDATKKRNFISGKLSSQELSYSQALASAWVEGKPLPIDKLSSLPVLVSSNSHARSIEIDHFNVTLNSCEVRPVLGTGSQLSEPPSRQGSVFLVLDVVFKNTDTESRMPFPGSVFASYSGKVYEFDNTESVWVEGWGLNLERINPLTMLNAKIAYRIPSDLSGNVDWVPGRNSSGAKLSCSI